LHRRVATSVVLEPFPVQLILLVLYAVRVLTQISLAQVSVQHVKAGDILMLLLLPLASIVQRVLWHPTLALLLAKMCLLHLVARVVLKILLAAPHVLLAPILLSMIPPPVSCVQLEHNNQWQDKHPVNLAPWVVTVQLLEQLFVQPVMLEHSPIQPGLPPVLHALRVTSLMLAGQFALLAEAVPLILFMALHSANNVWLVGSPLLSLPLLSSLVPHVQQEHTPTWMACLLALLAYLVLTERISQPLLATSVPLELVQ
jgi:hypothetical protein